MGHRLAWLEDFYGVVLIVLEYSHLFFNDKFYDENVDYIEYPRS